jgi:melibiose permease/lactose/raffinose/galactose permease
MEPINGRLSSRNLWSYTLASIGRDTATFLFSAYLMTYVLYTKTLTDFQYSMVTMAMVFARIFDGFNDPIMGNILEVTRTKWGKFKPWIAIGMVFSAIVFYVSFSNTLDGWAYVALFAVMYFVYSITFTMNDISYWGMLPSLASRKEDRDRLTSRTVLFAGIGEAIASIVVPTFTAGELTIGGSAVSAYRVIALIFIACFVGAQMITLLGIKEKPLPPKGAATVNRVSVKTIFRTIRNNDQLSWCIAVYLLCTVGSGIINSGLGLSYIFFEFGYNGTLFTVFSALGGIASGAVMLFFTPISKRFNRAQLMKTATVSVLGGNALMLLFGLLLPGGGILKFALLMVANLFAFTGQNLYYLVITICLANTVEYNEWKTGVRAEGIIFSARPFITKLGYAVIQLMALAIYLLTGVREFTNQISDLENAAAKGLGAAQKSEAIKAVLAGVPAGKSTALLACVTILPSLLAIASYYFYAKKFTITEDRYEQILAELKERRGISGA